MDEFPKFLGWTTAILYGAALLNFFLKRFNKLYVSKLPKEKNTFIENYRILMKFTIKNHKWFGISAGFIVLVHFLLMATTRWISNQGIAAMTVLLATILLGVYGAYINKNLRGGWVKFHRIAAFAVLALIYIHLVS